MIRKSVAMLILLVALTVTLSNPWATRAADQTYTVVNTQDIGVGSLRRAINQANTHAGSSDVITIDFDLQESDPNYDAESGVWTITLDTALPALIANHITIDGYSQEGAEYGTIWRSPILVVVIDGSNLVVDPPLYGNSGFNILSAGNNITGLVIQNFPVNGISIGGAAARDNTIAGNCIGTDYVCAHPEGNAGDGVFIGLGAKNNLVGGDTPEAQNFILDNGLNGVAIHGSNTSGNHLLGNVLIGNQAHGVMIYGGAKDNIVGGSTEIERNIISLNGRDGIRIQGDGTTGNMILGNHIGTATEGNVGLANDENGVQITLGAQENFIGGDSAGSGNLISGNLASGVLISGTNTISNTVSGNMIGMHHDGIEPIPNGDGVMLCCGASHNLIGGGSAGERNVISGNQTRGITITGDGTDANVISGNFIGTTPDGKAALKNGNYGIMMTHGVQDNLIGGSGEFDRNVISSNDDGGISMGDSNTSGNTIVGNYIGVAADGSTPLGNAGFGISISKTPDGNTVGPGNVIANNQGNGIQVYHSSSLMVMISQNRIYHNAMGIILDEGANGGITPPLILSMAENGTVSGTACVGCTVELFWNNTPEGQGKFYLGSTTADSAGEFSFSLSPTAYYNLTATATDPTRGTSGFSEVYQPVILTYLPLIIDAE
jgi:hypothetical protein